MVTDVVPRLTGDPDLRRSLVARPEDGAWYPLRAPSRSHSWNGPPNIRPHYLVFTSAHTTR
jgi:hypothetical protein